MADTTDQTTVDDVTEKLASSTLEASKLEDTIKVSDEAKTEENTPSGDVSDQPKSANEIPTQTEDVTSGSQSEKACTFPFSLCP